MEEIRLGRQKIPATKITQVNYLLKWASKKTFPKKKNFPAPKQHAPPELQNEGGLSQTHRRLYPKNH